MTLSDKIQNTILSNTTTPLTRRVGIEVESLYYDKNLARLPVNQNKHFSATDLYLEISATSNQAWYSLEPGGQLEWASPAFLDMHHIDQCFKNHLQRCKKILNDRSILELDLSLEPVFAAEDIELIRHKRYKLMHENFKRTGSLGPWMMRNTTSVQINLDVVSKKDAEEMAFLADVFQPFAALLFANSPFRLGKPTGTENVRYNIWEDTDPARCGSLLSHGLNSPENLLEWHAAWVQQVPAIFTKSEKGIVQYFTGTLGDYLGSIENVDDESILFALHQIFTHTRFKKVLEIRGADRPPAGYELAPLAFWLGLLTGIETKTKVLDLALSLSPEERKQLIKNSATLDLGLEGPRGQNMKHWMKIVLDLVLEGLDERSRMFKIENERIFFDNYLEDFFSNGFMSLKIQNEFSSSGLILNQYLKKRCAENL